MQELAPKTPRQRAGWMSVCKILGPLGPLAKYPGKYEGFPVCHQSATWHCGKWKGGAAKQVLPRGSPPASGVHRCVQKTWQTWHTSEIPRKIRGLFSVPPCVPMAHKEIVRTADGSHEMRMHNTSRRSLRSVHSQAEPGNEKRRSLATRVDDGSGEPSYTTRGQRLEATATASTYHNSNHPRPAGRRCGRSPSPCGRN
jgi:hypothetical protein